MRYASLIAAAGLILLANAFTLTHAARNRAGEAEAEIVLTDRELVYQLDSDDSGVALGLRWVDPGALRYSTAVKPDDIDARAWLGRKKLEELGFDCSVDPSVPNAYSFYNRQGARAAFVALEYDGPAWQSWIEIEQQMAKAQLTTPGQTIAVDAQRHQSSRLAAIDAARDGSVLRSRHPDRNRVLIVPAIIRASVVSTYRRGKAEYLNGYIQEIPSVIHVPRPFSDEFRTPGRRLFRSEKQEDPLYRVRLRYGRLLEPWVVGVEFVNSVAFECQYAAFSRRRVSGCMNDC